MNKSLNTYKEMIFIIIFYYFLDFARLEVDYSASA